MKFYKLIKRIIQGNKIIETYENTVDPKRPRVVIEKPQNEK